MNHFENFIKVLDTKFTILSGQAREDLITLVNSAMADAYERGQKNALLTHVCKWPR